MLVEGPLFSFLVAIFSTFTDQCLKEVLVEVLVFSFLVAFLHILTDEDVDVLKVRVKTLPTDYD